MGYESISRGMNLFEQLKTHVALQLKTEKGARDAKRRGQFVMTLGELGSILCMHSRKVIFSVVMMLKFLGELQNGEGKGEELSLFPFICTSHRIKPPEAIKAQLGPLKSYGMVRANLNQHKLKFVAYLLLQ